VSAVPVIGLDPTAEHTPLEYSPKTDERQRRKREVRATTVSARQLGKRSLQLAWDELGDTSDLPQRPRTRSECQDGPRPCPFVSCQHHLYLDVSPDTGSIKYNFPDLEPEQLEHSCVLDLAGRGGMTLEEVGAVMNVTRERIRQLEERATRKLEARANRSGFSAYRGHAHDFDHAEIIAPQLPIVSRSAVYVPPAPSVSPAVPVVSTEEITMAECTNGCGRRTNPAKLKHPGPPGTEGMCFRCIRKKGGTGRPTRQKAAPSDAGVTMDVAGLSVADLIESHRLVQLIGIDVLRAIADRLEKGPGGA
jgi:hypothetical protein